MIHTSDISYSYDGNAVLSFGDINIEKGSHTLILGKSGCGKTTLLHLLAGLRKPGSGSIKILDAEMTNMSQEKLDQFRGAHIGMIFQVPHFIRSLTVLENLTLAQSLAGKEVDEKKCLTFLEQLNLPDKAHKKTSELSVGEQQRVAIIRSLIHEPKIIFADEPTSALDDDNAMQVIQLLKKQANSHDATLIVVTHDGRLKDQFQHQISL